MVRGQLLTYLRKYGNTEYPALLDFALRNLLTNCWTQPDFIAYDVRERENLSLQLCRKLYHVCEVDWTVRSPELYRKVKADYALVIFENFHPEQHKQVYNEKGAGRGNQPAPFRFLVLLRGI